MRLTILRESSPLPDDPQALALSALGWVLGDAARADRLLALTGITPNELRARLTDPAMLAALLEFLLQHEPDLLACATTLGVKPEALAAAHASLNAPWAEEDRHP